MVTLTDKDKKRYHRQLILPEFGAEAQQKLKQASVLVIGAGGLGAPILKYLCSTGIGRLGFMDDDTVDVSNLQRQIIYKEQDKDQLKAVTGKRHLQELNSTIQIEAYPYRLTKENAGKLFAQYDIVIDACDNFKTRYLISEVAQQIHIPWIYGTVFEYGGQVSVFNGHNQVQYTDLYPGGTRTRSNIRWDKCWCVACCTRYYWCNSSSRSH